jgi:hypothetical protein
MSSYNEKIIIMMTDQVVNLAKVESKLSQKHTIVYSDMVNHYVKHNGVDYTIKIIKQLKNYVERYSMGLEVEPIRFLKSNKRGFPNLLRPYKGFISGSPSQKRAVVSLFKIVDNLTVEPKMDTTSITAPSTGVIPPEMVKYAEDFNGIRKYSESYTNIHLSSKAGPNGKATICRIKDLQALSSEPEILQALCNLHSASGIGVWLKEVVNRKKHFDDGIYRSCKLSLIRDKAGKTRVIAIGDYWSQSALKPIHNWLITRLKRITSDATHSQGIAKRHITAKLNKANFVGTADLSRATDRFPAALTASILRKKLGDEKCRD